MIKKHDIRPLAEKNYAILNGWKPTRRHATLSEISAGRRHPRNQEMVPDQLAGMWNRASVYEWIGSQRPAGVVVRPYRRYSQQEIDAVAQRYGVRALIFDPSWYHPDAQTIVFTSKMRPS